ncbi:MAG: hypothetical protein ACMZ66_05355 [Thalassospira sp.]|uniref:hypothetical protein n=1 Tax=Thalassospira sp. TaxID=1912094 RepID=UPI003A858B51
MVKVIATAKGYFGGRIREIDAKFSVPDEMFSDRWMKPEDPEWTPPKKPDTKPAAKAENKTPAKTAEPKTDTKPAV